MLFLFHKIYLSFNSIKAYFEIIIQFKQFSINSGCVPYSKDACKEAAVKLNMSFTEGDYSYKGCYTYYEGQYKGKIWFGTGGTDAERKGTIAPNRFKIFRAPWSDCEGNVYTFS